MSRKCLIRNTFLVKYSQYSYPGYWLFFWDFHLELQFMDGDSQ